MHRGKRIRRRTRKRVSTTPARQWASWCTASSDAHRRPAPSGCPSSGSSACLAGSSSRSSTPPSAATKSAPRTQDQNPSTAGWGNTVGRRTYRARLDVIQPRPRHEREGRRAGLVEPLPSGGLARLRVELAVGPRAARRADEQEDVAEAPVAEVQPVLDFALERGAVEQGEVRVEVDEVQVDELGYGVRGRKIAVLERGRGAGGLQVKR